MTKFEATARDIKARKLADVLIAHGATADAVTDIPESHRAITAQLAGVRNPSPLTWLAVAELVAAHTEQWDRFALGEYPTGPVV